MLPQLGLLSIGAGLLSKAADKLFSGDAREERKQVREAKKKVKKAAKIVKESGKIEVKETDVVGENVKNQLENVKQFFLKYWYIFAGVAAVIVFVFVRKRFFPHHSPRRFTYRKKKSNVSTGTRSRSSGKRLTGHAFYLKMKRAKEAKARKS
jgi:hypothetical protein